jgi:hypothetical protein
MADHYHCNHGGGIQDFRTDFGRMPGPAWQDATRELHSPKGPGRPGPRHRSAGVFFLPALFRRVAGRRRTRPRPPQCGGLYSPRPQGRGRAEGRFCSHFPIPTSYFSFPPPSSPGPAPARHPGHRGRRRHPRASGRKTAGLWPRYPFHRGPSPPPGPCPWPGPDAACRPW